MALEDVGSDGQKKMEMPRVLGVLTGSDCKLVTVALCRCMDLGGTEDSAEKWVSLLHALLEAASLVLIPLRGPATSGPLALRFQWPSISTFTSDRGSVP